MLFIINKKKKILIPLNGVLGFLKHTIQWNNLRNGAEKVVSSLSGMILTSMNQF